MKKIAIIGGGPAGLMAAEILAVKGHKVTIYDHMPSIGRKFLMAGRGGLNLTHSEEIEPFIKRYGKASAWLETIIRHFPPQALCDWCHDLGEPTFIGTSGRIFPKSLKASPLLRAWLRRLNQQGVTFALRHRWLGWDDKQNLIFETADKKIFVESDAVLLALGGASWPKLGSDGSWTKILAAKNIKLAPLQPSNCGFVCNWSDIFRERAEGQALKPVTMSFGDHSVQGEAMITTKGIEGGVIYALSAALRDGLLAEGSAKLVCDLRPGLSLAELTKRLEAPRGSRSLSNHLRKCSGLSPVAIGLLYETNAKEILHNASPYELAQLIKNTQITLTGISGIERAISTAGGISHDALDDHLMLKNLPGVFAAGEMLDWEAPTGGYLLQASFSTAVTATNGMLQWIADAKP